MEDREKNGSLEMHLDFSVIYRHGRIMNDRAVRCYGLTGQQMGYLKCINENPGISQEELARTMRIDKGAVAKAVKDMETKGYVSRRQNPQDRRAYCLFPTEKAREAARHGEQHARQLERQLTEGLSAEEIETFKRLLGKITGNMARILEGGKETI